MVACLPYLFAALEDRTAEVRKAAHDATLPFMIHLGYETLARNAGKLKPTSKTLVLAQLDKVRPNLPVKAAPPPAAIATTVKTRVPVPQAQKEIAKEEEDSATSKPVPGKVLRAPSKSKV